MNYFNSEFQLKDTESEDKLIYLISELRGFKLGTILVLDLKKKHKMMIKTIYSTSYLNSNAKTKTQILKFNY